MVEARMKSKKSYEKMLMDGKLKNAKQELYWDMFLFCIFTGLSFSDMRNLKEENIVTYFDDHQWIKSTDKRPATTILQSNEVPIETVSSILGHKNISTTQIYAKITKEKRLGNIEKV